MSGAATKRSSESAQHWQDSLYGQMGPFRGREQRRGRLGGWERGGWTHVTWSAGAIAQELQCALYYKYAAPWLSIQEKRRGVAVN